MNKMRESVIMKIHYGTALAAVALVAVHILMRLTQSFAESLEYENVIANYQFHTICWNARNNSDPIINTWIQWTKSYFARIKARKNIRKSSLIWLSSSYDRINCLWFTNNNNGKHGDDA